MKKFILPCALALLAVSACAEEMRLVTLLSQPVGSFARVELLDSSKPAKIYNLNFCNTGSSGGTITVTGTSATYPVNATYFVSESGSTLSSREEQGAPVKTYKVVSGGSSLSSDGDSWNPGTVYLVGGADLLGGTLKTSKVDFTNDSSYRRGLLVAEEDRGDTEFVLPGTAVASVGSFYRMNINSGAVAVFDTPASGSTRCDGLGWDKVASVVSSDDTYKDTNTDAKVLLGCTKDLTPQESDEDKCKNKHQVWDAINKVCKDVCLDGYEWNQDEHRCDEKGAGGNYTWSLANCQSEHCCGSTCPTGDVSSVCQGSCAEKGMSFSVRGSMGNDGECPDAETCDCICE